MADPLVPSWAAPVFRQRLAQPDQTTCGPTCLVVARILQDEEYAGRATAADTFRTEVLDLHRRVTSPRDTLGRMQLPWPRFFGTPPWAAARQMKAITGAPYDSDLVLSGRSAAYDRVVEATTAGRRVPVFVGSTWVPRHVVLAIGVVEGADGAALRFYEPARGRLVDVTRDAFANAKLDLAGWDRPWFVVLPD
jgi:hypothetical protein